VVEDDPVAMGVLKSLLASEGYEVVEAATGSLAVQAVRERAPDLMILDLGLLDENPGNSLNYGLCLLHYLRRAFPEACFPVIIHTVDESPNLEAQAEASGVSAVFRKGCSLTDLLHAIRKVLREAPPADEADVA